MPTTRQFILHDNIHEGVETTAPSHLIPPTKWRTQHNVRMTPALEQVPRKKLYATIGSADIRNIAMVPSITPGYGKVLLFGTTQIKRLTSGGSSVDVGSTLSNNGIFRKFAIELYNGFLFYTNEQNAIKQTDGSTVATFSNAPAARYLIEWYDHLLVAYPTYIGQAYPHRVMMSDLFNFNVWQPDHTNEATFYDFVEWQQSDYPFVGITGLGKLKGVVYVYTPTAIIPLHYVGRPKVIQVRDSGVVTRIGNTHPWALACLDNLHFFYDGIENQFWAFDGQTPIPIGEPVRRYLADTINTNPEIASRMWSYIDVQNREIWWVFVSTGASTFDKAVVFNYRLRRWFTASVENVQSFCGPIFLQKTVAELNSVDGPTHGYVGELTGTCALLGLSTAQAPRFFGADAGKLYREEIDADTTASLASQEDPVLETGDFLYGDLSTVKENDVMSINATWDTTRDPTMKLEVRASGREYASTAVDWTATATQGKNWVPNMTEKWVNYPAKSGKILRYRFKGTNARGLKFSAFEDGVFAQKAEK